MSHFDLEVFLCLAIFIFVGRIPSRMFLSGSCSSRPSFSLFICLTSCWVSVHVSHISLLTLLISHSVQFFLAVVLAILAHCRLVFCCLPKPRPRLPAIPLSHLYYCHPPRHTNLIRLLPPMTTTTVTTTTTTTTMTTTSPPSVRYATFAISVTRDTPLVSLRGSMRRGDGTSRTASSLSAAAA